MSATLDADIVIVGGGAAGVGAARRLARSAHAALLLEASASLGGRASTQRLHGLDLDLGCGWLHSADRNAWAAIAAESGLPIDRTPPAWGTQFKDLGFPPAEQDEAHHAFGAWMQRMAANPPASDCAADALEPGNPWNPYIRAIAAFISGARLEQVSIADYMAYDEASTESNWRVHAGYGTLITRSVPDQVRVKLATPVESIELSAEGVHLRTPAGTVKARAAILTVSTHVLAGGTLQLPSTLDPWREAARQLPLGHNEKLFLEISGDGVFEPETQVYGNPRDVRTGAYYIRPFGMPVIEGFFGGEAADVIRDGGPAAGFAHALDQLAALFGAGVRKALKPMAVSNWSRLDRIGGAYSCALPGQSCARTRLARPYEQRLFFAGEATSVGDYSTAHGAHDTGVRAAEEALAALRQSR